MNLDTAYNVTKARPPRHGRTRLGADRDGLVRDRGRSRPTRIDGLLRREGGHGRADARAGDRGRRERRHGEQRAPGLDRDGLPDPRGARGRASTRRSDAPGRRRRSAKLIAFLASDRARLRDGPDARHRRRQRDPGGEGPLASPRRAMDRFPAASRGGRGDRRDRGGDVHRPRLLAAPAARDRRTLNAEILERGGPLDPCLSTTAAGDEVGAVPPVRALGDVRRRARGARVRAEPRRRARTPRRDPARPRRRRRHPRDPRLGPVRRCKTVPVADAAPPPDEVTVQSGSSCPMRATARRSPTGTVWSAVSTSGHRFHAPLRRAPAPPPADRADAAAAADASDPAAAARELSEGPHLSYAIQWFSFAAIAVVGAVILLRRERRAPTAAP